MLITYRAWKNGQNGGGKMKKKSKQTKQNILGENQRRTSGIDGIFSVERYANKKKSTFGNSFQKGVYFSCRKKIHFFQQNKKGKRKLVNQFLTLFNFE